MRIQHNIAALNSYRQLSGNNSAVSKNLEKLSSGYKINRAGDDAAGLAISEKMRAQITGLETAQKNANDGISLVQTAEGALTEVHSMLNRMVELATQSANGTYDNTVDRNNLQKEFDSLLEEVDRISEATNFNGINLLDGSLGGGQVKDVTTGTKTISANPVATGTTVTAPVKDSAINGANGATKASITFDLAGMEVKAPTNGATDAKFKLTIAGQATNDITVSADMDASAIASKLAELHGTGKELTIGGQSYAITANGSKITLTSTTQSTNDVATVFADGIKLEAGKVTAGTNGTGTPVLGTASTATIDFDGRTGGDVLGGTVKIGNTTYSFVEDATKAKEGTTAIVVAKDAKSADIAKALSGAVNAGSDFTAGVDGAAIKLTEATKDAAGDPAFSGEAINIEFKGTGLRLQVGDTDDDFQKVRVAVGDMSTKGLGLDTLKNVGIADQTTAGTSIDKIKAAINTVSSTRGDLGAIQNRLEHTINNLGVTTENMTAAESRIRDTDMAQEMMSYTKNNILVQAAQAMLAQANQVPQGVLQLLQ